jgi:hypothetical protein
VHALIIIILSKVHCNNIIIMQLTYSMYLKGAHDEYLLFRHIFTMIIRAGLCTCMSYTRKELGVLTTRQCSAGTLSY